MERNAVVATVLVVLILIGYQWYLSRYEVPVQEPSSQATSQAVQKPTPAPTPAVAVQPAAPRTKPAAQSKRFTPTSQLGLAPREVTVETPLMRVVLSTAGARVTHWQLKTYHLDSGAPVDLVANRDAIAAPGPLGAWLDDEQVQGVFQADKTSLDLTRGEASGTVTFKHVTGAGIELQKQLTFHADGYRVDVAMTIGNLAEGEVQVQPRLAWGPGLRDSHQNKKGTTLQPPTVWLDGKRVQEDLSKLGKDKEKNLEGALGWAALQDAYFAAALLPKDKGWVGFIGKTAEDQPVVGLTTGKQAIEPGGQLILKADVFAGPRDLDTLKRVGSNLEQLVDLGWFDFLARPALWLLKFLYYYTGNYGIAIILITILQKIAFHPLTHKSLKSMQAMQAMQPKVQAIQERYKNNPKKKQEETMTLYRKHGVNPMGGCLPMLVQIPIFIALYNALSSSVEMWQARFLWIRDLTQADSLFILGVWGDYTFSMNVLALLMGVSMWLQQKMAPTTGDPRQAQMMLWMMPIIFTFMFWSFPSGLVLYWLVNNILQIGQQWLINRGGTAHPPAPEGQAA